MVLTASTDGSVRYGHSYYESGFWIWVVKDFKLNFKYILQMWSWLDDSNKQKVAQKDFEEMTADLESFSIPREIRGTAHLLEGITNI